MAHTILILPGLFNSGAGHWQTLWQEILPAARRVQQQDWDAPLCDDWIATLDAAIRAANGTVTLAAHSLGCALALRWCEQQRHAPHAGKVTGAMLVAPPDVERADFPAIASGFAPMPRARLPFASIVLASSNDPWCALAKAQGWARDWGAQFHDIGPHGHINDESGLGDWPQARHWLAELLEAKYSVVEGQYFAPDQGFGAPNV
jgi:predicted alpha/beta hydrolase family esterase